MASFLRFIPSIRKIQREEGIEIPMNKLWDGVEGEKGDNKTINRFRLNNEEKAEIIIGFSVYCEASETDKIDQREGLTNFLNDIIEEKYFQGLTP